MARAQAQRSTLPPNIQERGLTIEQAAEYCGCETVEAFASWRKRGIVPGPMPGTTRWDRKALDLALDRLSGLAKDRASSFDEWAAANAS